MSPLHIPPPLWGLVFSVSGATLLWLISLRIRDVSIVDIFWGPGVAGVADIAAFLGHASGDRVSIALFLVNLWGLRLAAHIWARHKGESRDHAAMRQQFGRRWWWQSFFQVFLLQAILIWFMPAPLVAVMLAGRDPLTWLDWTGAGLAILGLLIETVADSQLARFRLEATNKTKVLDRGLWAWSRHPNYFGESLLWWGFFLLGFAAVHQWWLILSPLLITFLLLEVSGASLMERDIEKRRPAYADYKRRVSSFIPIPRRRGKS